MPSFIFRNLPIILILGLSVCAGAEESGEEAIASQGRVNSLMDGTERPNTSLANYNQPTGWIVTILKQMFKDIDWNAIEYARTQIVKFIEEVDTMVGPIRSILTKATSGNSDTTSRDSRTFASRWWGSSSKATPSMGPDSTSVKEMLERVACFVGYMRLMNLSNEALAELDASKVVTNLFGSVKRNSSSWSWFG